MRSAAGSLYLSLQVSLVGGNMPSMEIHAINLQECERLSTSERGSIRCHPCWENQLMLMGKPKGLGNFDFRKPVFEDDQHGENTHYRHRRCVHDGIQSA